MKKGLLAIILVLTLACFSFSSCSKKSDDADDIASSVTDKADTKPSADSDNKTEPDTDDNTDSSPDDKTDPDSADKKDPKPTDKDEPDSDNKPEPDTDDKTESDSEGSTDCQHTFGEWKAKRTANCVWGGEDARTCSKCGYAEKRTTPKSDKHVEVIDPAVAATCSAYGKTEGKHCSYCFDVLVPQENTPKKEHIFKNGYTCECGDFIDSAKFVVLSQNVRYNNDGPGKNISDRAPRLKQLVEKYKVDLIGTQEATPTWNNYFKENFKDYGMIGCSRDGENATSGEWGTILYRLDRFELIDSDTFWLSDTPHKVSRVSGSKCNRICTWALLKDKNTGKTFIFANTHLDHGTDEVREQQIKILFEELSDLMSKYPLILTGDFNATPDSAVYNAATDKLVDSRTDSLENRTIIEHTFDSYGQSRGKIIDYCFYNKSATACWYKVAEDQFGGYVSDHYGVVTQFGIK